MREFSVQRAEDLMLSSTLLYVLRIQLRMISLCPWGIALWSKGKVGVASVRPPTNIWGVRIISQAKEQSSLMRCVQHSNFVPLRRISRFTSFRNPDGKKVRGP